MTGFGAVIVGRLVLREALSVAGEKTGADGSTLSLSGQEASPPLTPGDIAVIQSDLRGLAGTLVPVRFTDKASLAGYYMVSDVAADLMDWQKEVVTCGWQINLVRVGSAAEVDLEARLAGPLTRVNAFSATGERWHAPPIGHAAYWSGSTTPSAMTRTGADGAMTVYRGVPVGVSPRYSCPVESYLTGRVRVADGGRERSGTRFELTPTVWEVHNTLCRVRVAAGFLSVEAWTGGGWAAKGWDILVNGTSMGAPAGAVVLRNDPECGIVRLLWSLPVGRVTCDVTLRRGSRLAELYIQTSTSATIKIVRTTAEGGTAATGFLRATSNDAAGNRYILGSALAFTADTATGGLTKSSAVACDAMVGVEQGGSAAVAGDLGGVLYQQYLGAAAEQTRASRR